jgi:hypothetical protein
MGWQDLLEKAEVITAPWVGGYWLQAHGRRWHIEDPLPREFDWYRFQTQKRACYRFQQEPFEPDHSILFDHRVGYLIGDHVVIDGLADTTIDLKSLGRCSYPVYLIPQGLERFSRVRVARFYENGPFLFVEQTFPLGPEPEVLAAYQDRAKSIDTIKQVSPALDLAFRLESWRRDETEAQRRLAQQRREQEEKRAALLKQLGDGQGRRELAKHDFRKAAETALNIGGAEYLDHRQSVNRNEMVVTFRLDGRRFECVCDVNMQIIDAGICLTDHDTGVKGDRYFTLESFPSVIRQAIRERKLVVWRHADDEPGEDFEDD